MTEQSLKNRISDAMKDAMRAKDKARLGAIRLMLADLKKVEIDERIEVDDARVVTILDKMVKQRRDSIQQYEAAERQELADREQLKLKSFRNSCPKHWMKTNSGASLMKQSTTVALLPCRTWARSWAW